MPLVRTLGFEGWVDELVLAEGHYAPSDEFDDLSASDPVSVPQSVVDKYELAKKLMREVFAEVEYHEAMKVAVREGVRYDLFNCPELREEIAVYEEDKKLGILGQY